MPDTCETKTTCGSCNDCYVRYPSLRPSVPPEKRLALFVQEVHRDPYQDVYGAINDLIEAVNSYPPTGSKNEN